MSSTSSDEEEYGQPTANLYQPAPKRIETSVQQKKEEVKEIIQNTEKLKAILIREGHSYDEFMIALWKDGEDESFYEDMSEIELEKLAKAFVKAQEFKPQEQPKIEEKIAEKIKQTEIVAEKKAEEIEQKKEEEAEVEDEEEAKEFEKNIGSFLKTVKVQKLESTELCTTEPIRVEILRAELSQRSSFLKGKFTIYTIHTLPFKWTVKRRYSDFVWLVKCLKMRFPAHYVSKLNIYNFRFQLYLLRL